MPEIKTRDYAARTVRSMNRVHNLSARMKGDMVRSREDQIDEKQYAVEATEQGAAEMLPRASEISIRRRIKIKGTETVEAATVDEPEEEITQTETKRSLIARTRAGSGKQQVSENHAKTGEGQVRIIQPRRARTAKTAAQQMAVKQTIIQKTREHTLLLRQKVVSGIRNVLRRIREAMKSLITALASGGVATVSAIIVICFIGIIVASPYGIFLSKDSDGETIPDVVQELSSDYYKGIEDIKRSVDYDDIEIRSNDGVYSLRWDEILSVFSVMLTTDTNNPIEVVTLDQIKKDLLKTLLLEMNSVGYSVETETYEETEIVEDEYGNEIEETIEKTKTTLILKLIHTSAEEEAARYSFTAKQMSFLNDLLSGKYSTLWAQLLGGYSGGLGIIPTDATWIGTGRYSWPLPVNGEITSGYGWRTDPFTGEQKFHGGIDIGVGAGTPIIAADAGAVTVANGVDSWGGGYGFYVMIDHGGGDETLYAHCSSICVQYGQTVQKGEVIAYVGSTGNSTGNHLHFEIRVNGNKKNPLNWFI